MTDALNLSHLAGFMPADGSHSDRPSSECEIDLVRREVRVRGSPVLLGARGFEIIEVLAESAGQIVTKDELMDRVWPGAVVNDNALQVHISAIRKALGSHREMLKTESGRGYRLLGSWHTWYQPSSRPSVITSPWISEAANSAGNLPIVVNSVIGRSDAELLLRELVSAYRVLTLTGPGGIGKTSLAMHLARAVLAEFTDGGWLVGLASLSDPNLVPSAVSSVLGLDLGRGGAPTTALAQAIGDKTIFWFSMIANTSSMRSRTWQRSLSGSALEPQF
jgi:DNA-binding winged helix-turn-helix (wHTH) protein